MALTLANMLDELRLVVGRDDSDLSDTQLTRWLNMAQHRVAEMYTFQEMLDEFASACVEDQKRYGFPERMKEIISLVLVDGSMSRKLTQVGRRTFDTLEPYPESGVVSGKPTHYVLQGTNFELFPIPDDTYTLKIYCSVFPADLSGDTDASDLLNKDELILAVATVRCFASLRQHDDAGYWRSVEVPALFSAAVAADRPNPDWMPVMQPFYSVPLETLDATDPFSGRSV